MKHIYTAFLLIFISINVYGIEAQKTDSTNKEHGGIGRNSSIIVPVAFYQEETSFGAGLMGGLYFTKNRVDKVSNLQGLMIYTIRNQFKFTILPKIYSNNKRTYISGHLRLSHYPDKFFGLGTQSMLVQEENFTSREISFLGQVQVMVYKSLMAGIQIGAERGEAIDVNTEGTLYIDDYVGVRPYFASSVGVLSTWDTRDNMFFATRGEFLKFSIMVSNKVFGSDINNVRVNFDARKYKEVFAGHIWATRLYSDLGWGQIPFQNLPALGGSEILRGYYQGRYRDNMLATVISEYRFPLYKRIRGALFVNAADVASSFSGFNLSTVKYSFGTGLRFRVNPAKLHIRFDVGITPTGRAAIYFSANEAF